MTPKLMKYGVVLLYLCVVCGLAVGRVAAQQSGSETLTNLSVLKLVRAGFGEKTLTAIINTRPTRFDLTPDRLIELKRSGVSEKVILAMIARDEGANVADENWNDAFFDEGINASPQKRGGDSAQPNGSAAGELNIFGSGSGNRGRTRSRVGNNTNNDDTQTTGSATVRIIRPPREAGDPPPKLERTPTLTNAAVVDLVDAGFSEGTIIRQIESSPAGFDLTPEKLAELRRRRVTEPVIVAMRAAMGDDQTSGAAAPVGDSRGSSDSNGGGGGAANTPSGITPEE